MPPIDTQWRSTPIVPGNPVGIRDSLTSLKLRRFWALGGAAIVSRSHLRRDS